MHLVGIVAGFPVGGKLYRSGIGSARFPICRAGPRSGVHEALDTRPAHKDLRHFSFDACGSSVCFWIIGICEKVNTSVSGNMPKVLNDTH